MIHKQIEYFAPQVLFIPFYDRHIDHRMIFNACMVAARPVGVGRTIDLVAAYETISETHWNAPHIEPSFIPNFCVDITEQIETKIEDKRVSLAESDLVGVENVGD